MESLAPPSHPTSFAGILALLDPNRPMDDDLTRLLGDLVSLAEEDLSFIPYHPPRNPSVSSPTSLSGNDLHGPAK